MAKKLLLLVYITIILFNESIAQQKQPLNRLQNIPASSSSNIRIGCSLFTDPNSYTNGSTFSYNAPTNNNSFLSGPSGANYNCLYTVPNQVWFIITVNIAGNLYFNYSNSNNYDVDAAIWGPIANNDVANACTATQSSPLTCDYDASRPDLYINNAQVGQKYVMLVTNYSNANTIINISQPTVNGGINNGAVTYSMVNIPNCSLIPTASISGTSTTITEGQPASLTLNFTGSSPWSYKLSDGTIGTSSTSPATVMVYPTASQTYTINSVSNVCGTNSASGSVGISVIRNTQLRSCFPLDGDVIDSQASLNTGALQNGVTTSTNRNNQANKALQFDGIDDYATIQTNQLINNTFAFATWVKLNQLPDANNTEQIILSLGATSDQHYLSAEYTNNTVSWKFASNNATIYSNATVNTDWHLLIGVRTGGQIRIYVDGLLTGSTNTLNTISYDSPLLGKIGSGINNNKFFNGKLDDLKIFSGSLIDPEILLLQNYTNCNDVVNDTYLSLQSISTTVICTNTAFTIQAFSNNLSLDNELQFVAELSNASGDFTNPTIVGSSQFLPLSATIPNTITGGNYKLRIKYGSTISVNNFDVFVNNPASHNITGTTTIVDGQTANLNLNFTGTGPWNFVLSNGLSGVATTSPWVIPVTPDQNTTYSISSAQNVCGTSTLNGNSSATISINFAKQFVSCLPFSNNGTDQKGNNTITVNGPLLTQNRYGQVNTAYSFNGSSDYIEYTTNLLRKREYTMSAWVLMNSLPSNAQFILSQGETSVNTFQSLGVSSSGWQFQSYSNGGIYTASSSTGLVANQWVYLTAVRTYQALKLYVNGDLVSTVSNNSIIPFKTSDIGRIGTNSSSFGNYFNGKIDDVRLYKGALNDEEVYALYLNTNDCPTVEDIPTIVVRSLSPTTLCAGNNVSVNFTTSNVSSPFNVLLSDHNGSFTNPTIIGNGTSSPISATIPITSIASSNYRIRVVSTNGTPVTSVNSRLLTVSGARPTATISGNASIQNGQSTDLTLSFTGTSPWTYAINNGSSQTTSTSPITVSVSPFSTTNYTITSLSNSCGSGNSTGTATVTVAPFISLGTLGSTTICAATNFTVSYQANFTPSTNFRVELSDITGSFSSPTSLGTGTSSPITVQIPNSIVGGIGYKIRVVSDSPVAQSAASTALTILSRATATITGTATINEGQSTNLTINFTGQSPWTYAINNGTSQTTSTNPLVVSASPLSTTPFNITSLSNTCGSGSMSGSATITVNPVAVRLVTCYPFNGNANDSKGLNDGTVNGPILTTDRFGNPNSAYLFDGVNDIIQASATAMNNADVTISVWFNKSFEPSALNYVFGVGNSNKIHSLITTGVGSLGAYSAYPDFTSVNSVINLNTWYHAVLVRSGNTLKLYLNGTLIGQNTNIANSYNATDVFFTQIGAGIYNNERYFQGKIDDIQYYKGALTDGQVQALYNSNDGCFDASTATVLNLGSLSSSSFCRGQSVSVPFSIANINTPIKVQLSDSNGSFSSPTEIGSGSTSPISVIIPVNQTSGTGYKIRLLSSDASPIVSNLSTSITINVPVTAILSGTTTINEGQSTNLVINFTGSAPYTYTITGGSSQSTSTNQLTIPVSPLVNTTYSITSLSNTCGIATGSGSAVITVNPVAVLLVSCFPFNGNANDGKGLNNGTVNGATLTTDRFGNANSAYYFNGFNNIQFPANGTLNSNFTYSLWFNVKVATVEFRKLLGIGNLTNYHGIAISRYNFPAYLIKYRDDNNVINLHEFTPTLGQWYNLILTKNGLDYKLYINGVSVAQGSSTSNATFPNDSFGLIGAMYENWYGTTFDGSIDDVQIYKGALSDGQVQALYNNNDGCFDASNTTNLNLSSLSSSSFCRGQSVSVPFSSANVATPIKVQLSDSNGSFTSPTEIGSGSTSPISATIPANLTIGTSYKIRLASSGATPVVSNISTSLSINAPLTATITGTATINEGQSTNLTINFTGTAPYTYAINNGTSQTTSTNPLSISVSPSTTTTYTITLLSNTCGNTTTSSSAVVTVNTVSTRLVSCFPFSGNANDGKGINNGTVNGAALTTDRFGNPNSAYNFDGAGSYIQTPTNGLLNANYTYSMWFNPVLNFETAALLSFGNNSNFQNIYINRGPGIYTIVYSENTSVLMTHTLSLNSNLWYNLVIVRDGNSLKLYLSGNLIATTSSQPFTFPNDSNINIGNFISSGSSNFNGKIDDVQFYKGALTDTQVQTLFNSSNGCFDGLSTTFLNLVMYSKIVGGKDTKRYYIPVRVEEEVCSGGDQQISNRLGV